MKNNVILILACIAVWSCKKEVPVNYVLLSGNIDNTKGGELKISSLNGFEKTINVQDNGVFSDTLFIEETGLFNLQFDKMWFTTYLSRGANVNFKMDTEQPVRSIELLGDYAELNNYFARKAAKEFDFMMDREGSYNMDEASFESKIEDFQNDLEQHLEAVADIPEGLKEREIRAIDYSRLAKKTSYERMYRFLTKNREFNASDAFKKEVSAINYENGEDYLHSLDYRRMVSQKINERAYELYEKDSLLYKEAMAKALAEVNNEVIKNCELYQSVSMGLAMSDDKNKDLEEFLAASTNENHKTRIKDLFEILKALDPGQPSPKFKNYENNDGSTTSLDDLKGKYVYIDVWATWCGPCKAEIPFLKEVEEEYQDNNIHFVSISTDSQKDKQKWKDMIVEKELRGIQLITDNDFNTQFIKDYKIMGIPQFILLDPNGHIVKANAPRPSDGKLIDLFNELDI